MNAQTTAAVTSLDRQSFAGVRLTQSWGDLWLWEQILNDVAVRAVIEIGTWEGGMSRFLWAQASVRGLGFVTLDAAIPDRPPPGFLQMDVFVEADRVRGMVEALAPVVLLCDGGDKPRELAEFGPALTAGSVLVVHDWGSEVAAADVPDCLEPIYEDLCDGLGSHSRVFRHLGSST